MISVRDSDLPKSIVESKRPVVYVIDDDASMRDTVGGLVRSIGLDVEVFESSSDFLAFARSDVPSCLILDVRLRGESGLAFQEEARERGIRMPILFVTGYADVGMTVKAMKAGAVDFFEKPFRIQDLLDAISRALKSDAERLASEQSMAALREAYVSLTPRERELLVYVVSGLRNKQIASELNISEVTAKIHRGQMMRKMAAHTLPDLVRKAQALSIHPTHANFAGTLSALGTSASPARTTRHG